MSGLPDINSLYHAYYFFNYRLFEDKLSVPVLTWCRKKGSCGYFWSSRYEKRRGEKDKHSHEIAINPDTITDKGDKEVLSTLVHEMVHLWQEDYGKAPRACYHDKQWANKMEEIGLMPSSTGSEGGKRTGQKMTHYVIEGGAFDTACNELLSGGWVLLLQGVPAVTLPKATQNKVKYECPDCDIRAWAKPGVSLVCGICGQVLKSGDDEGEDKEIVSYDTKIPGYEILGNDHPEQWRLSMMFFQKCPGDCSIDELQTVNARLDAQGTWCGTCSINRACSRDYQKCVQFGKTVITNDMLPKEVNI